MLCLGVCFLGSKFFGTLWASWTSQKSISFGRFGKLSFIIFSHKFSISCSSSSPSGTPMIWMMECLKLSQMFLSLYSFFWLLVSSFCSGWMFISCFWSKSLIWVPVSFPSLMVPCTFSFISLYIAFTLSSNLRRYSSNSVSILITSFWTLHLIGWLCLHHLVLFLELWSILSFGPWFFVSTHLLHSKGRSLRFSTGWGNPHLCVVMLCGGEGSVREQCHWLRSLPAFSHFCHYPQVNWALLVLVPKWVGLCSF